MGITSWRGCNAGSDCHGRIWAVTAMYCESANSGSLVRSLPKAWPLIGMDGAQYSHSHPPPNSGSIGSFCGQEFSFDTPLSGAARTLRHAMVSRQINTARILSSAFSALCCVLLLSLPGCGDGESNVVSGNRDGVLHYGNGTEPQGLDPHVVTGVPENHIIRALFEGLAVKNPITLEPEPGVAERWELQKAG